MRQILWTNNKRRRSALRLCRLQYRSFRRYLVSFWARKTRAQRATYRAPEYNMPLWLTDWLWRLSLFLDRSNSTKMEEYIEYLLLVKVNRIPFSGSRGIVENVSVNQRSGRSSCFSNRPENYKLGRGCYDLAFCLVSSNWIMWFQRNSRKCLSQSKVRAAILVFLV